MCRFLGRSPAEKATSMIYNVMSPEIGDILHVYGIIGSPSREKGGEGDESEEDSHLRRDRLAAVLPHRRASTSGSAGDEHPQLVEDSGRGPDHLRATVVLGHPLRTGLGARHCSSRPHPSSHTRSPKPDFHEKSYASS